MHPLLMNALRLIYPIPDVALKREKPLEVLCLGCSRAGTESLRNVLLELGYADVHHGFRFIWSNSESLPWLRLARAQCTNNASGLTTKEFDKVIGDCEAVTDQPSCGFAHELLTAYPDAKVILNYREDTEKWHQSVNQTLEKFTQEQGFYAWLLSWFQSDLFWQQHVTFYWLWRRYFDGDFEKNGMKWYHEHYRSLEERLQKDERKYLKWKVQDEWEPLCEFLGKRVPTSDFPSGNTPYEYRVKIAKVVRARRRQAERNFFNSVIAVVVFLLIMVYMLFGRQSTASTTTDHEL